MLHRRLHPGMLVFKAFVTSGACAAVAVTVVAGIGDTWSSRIWVVLSSGPQGVVDV